MRAELNTGEIVTLQKDCGCVTHNDPHWTYMDRVAADLNSRLLEPTGKTPEQRWHGLHGAAIEEGARLAQKLRDMQRRGIVRLIPDEFDDPVVVRHVPLGVDGTRRQTPLKPDVILQPSYLPLNEQ